MKIYSWNVNGIRAVERKGAWQDFIGKHKPDIVCIQETKAQYGQIELDLPDYEEFWCSADKKGYSGTAIFSKIAPEEVLYGLPEHIVAKYALADNYGDTSKEGRVLSLEFPNFYLSTVYTPNAKDDLSRIPIRQQWDPAYLEYMCELNEQKPVIFCGDLNVAHTELDLARPKENQGKKGFTTEERTGIDHMIQAGFVDSLRVFNKESGQYTWWSHWGGARERNVGWRIDYVFVSEALRSILKNARIHPDQMGSDHCPVSIDIALD
ncbi:exodeoxyribonuclease III [Candidatus Kaiserbacteria bacterium]|nr:exodeoxyribonuclease III [Candidatus Kaiserbacteria bacterium]